MACNESDDKLEIQNEIHRLEKERMSLGDSLYEIAMKRKFINHRLADLRYKLKHMDDELYSFIKIEKLLV